MYRLIIIFFPLVLFGCSTNDTGVTLMSLTPDTDRIFEGQTLRVTARLSPASPIVEAGLYSAEGALYGEFVDTSVEDATELVFVAEITWDKINQVADITSGNRNHIRTFEARIRGADTTEIRDSFDVTLACADDGSALCEPGRCFPLATDHNHCGSCGNSTYGNGDIDCTAGVLQCENQSLTPCTGECRGLNTRDECQLCDNDCIDKLNSVIDQTTATAIPAAAKCRIDGCEIEFVDYSSRFMCSELCALVGMTCLNTVVYYDYGNNRDTSYVCDDFPLAFDESGDPFDRQECTCSDQL